MKGNKQIDYNNRIDLMDKEPEIEDGMIDLCTNNNRRFLGWVRKSSLKKRSTWRPRLYVVGCKDGEIQDIDTYVTHWKRMDSNPVNKPKGSSNDYSLKQ